MEMSNVKMTVLSAIMWSSVICLSTPPTYMYNCLQAVQELDFHKNACHAEIWGSQLLLGAANLPLPRESSTVRPLSPCKIKDSLLSTHNMCQTWQKDCAGNSLAFGASLLWSGVGRVREKATDCLTDRSLFTNPVWWSSGSGMHSMFNSSSK